MKRRMLEGYAAVLVVMIQTMRRIFPPPNDPLAPGNWAHRDFEWFGGFRCPNCGHRTRHHFVEWLPERVVTAECGSCGFEATL